MIRFILLFVMMVSSVAVMFGALTYTRVVVSPTSPVHSSIKSIGDLDGDGKPDLIVSGANGPIVWFKNPTWVQGTITTGGASDAGSAMGDIDGDGDIDVVVGRDWYENVNNGTSWIAHHLSDEVQSHDICIADMNGDGKKDIVYRGEEFDPVTIFLQGATPTTWTHFEIPIGLGGNHHNGLDVADIDNDGKLDFAVHGLWGKNPGGNIATTPWPKYTFATWNPLASVTIKDMDGDGRKDIVLSVSDGTGNLSWFKAPVDPTTNAWIEKPIATGVTSVHAFVVSDIDNDGLQDVTISESEGRLIIYYNHGTSWQPVVLGTDQLHNLRGADLNGDGHTDFFGVHSAETGTYPAIVYISDDISLPITLSQFTGSVHGSAVKLDWETLTEVNNFGFDVQRAPDPTSYQTLTNSFVPGHGTTNEPQHYGWTDSSASQGVWYYRLKQTDLDGTIHFSDGVRVDILTGINTNQSPLEFVLTQNFPNPFNPSTTIRYAIPQASRVVVSVYNMLGQQISQLVNEYQTAGWHEVSFHGNELNSGVYFYRLQAGSFTQNKKLLLMK